MYSHTAIPFVRDKDKQQNPEALSFYKHIGIYGYRTETLKALIKLPTGNLEAAKSLEQLRWLEHGFEIYTAETAAESTGIDTYEDLLEVNRQQDERR
ncbi:MAG: hypothetical protein U5L09_09280 [Bacteroidales bacterium]|nr:hypothetical protein [Bacteroidales bacterium]